MIKKFILYLIFLYLFACAAFAGNQTTSSTPASTIATNARYYLNDPTVWGGTQKNVWSDTQLLEWVNKGTLEIVSKTKCLEGTEDITLIPNTEEYTVTGPYISIERVVYNDLQHSNKKELEALKSIGRTREQEPSFWYEWNGKLGVFPPPVNITDANLAIGSTTTNVATDAITYYVNNKAYTKSAVPVGTAPGDDVIPQSKYGAVAFDIGADATIDAVEAYGNATGHTTAALASSALPPVSDGHVRLGYVTATKSDGAFTFGTTALNAANTTVAYTDSIPTITVYFISRPSTVTGSENVLVPSQYDEALAYYVAIQALIMDRKFNKATIMTQLYDSELRQYRFDLSDLPGEE